MIPGVRSLEEAIEYVKDPDVKEELQHQYSFSVKPKLEKLEEVTNLEDDLEEAQDEIDDLRRECENLEDNVAELECAEETLDIVRSRLIGCVGKLTAEKAVDYLNEVLRALDERTVEIVSKEEYDECCGKLPF